MAVTLAKNSNNYKSRVNFRCLTIVSVSLSGEFFAPNRIPVFLRHFCGIRAWEFFDVNCPRRRREFNQARFGQDRNNIVRKGHAGFQLLVG